MKKIKMNLIYSSIYQLFAIIVPIVTTPYLSRVLGADGVGQYGYAYSVSYFFSIFITLGLNSYGNRTIAIVKKNKKELAATFWNIYTMQIIAGLLVSLFYIVFSIFWRNSSLINIIMIGVVFSSCIDISWFFYGMEEFKAITIRDMVIKTITIICIFAFVHNKEDVWIYAVIRTAGFLGAQILLWPFLIKQINFVKPKYHLVLSHIKPNLILFIPTIAISLYKTMDKVMLGALSGQVEVGYYESCEKIIQIPMALIMALGNVMLPHMSSLYSDIKFDKEKAMRIIRESEYLIIMISSLISFGIMTIANEFVSVFFGEGFSRCVCLLYILMPSCIFLAFANVIRTQYMIPNKYDKEFTISLFTGATFNLVINSLLIPKIQSVGAAIGTLVAEMAVCVTQMCFIHKQIPIIRIFFECISSILISAIMFIFGLVLPFRIDNVIVRMLVKIIVCGFFWGIAMIAYYFIQKYIYKKEYSYNFLEQFKK